MFYRRLNLDNLKRLLPVVFTLRRRRLALLVCAVSAVPDDRAATASAPNRPISTAEGLFRKMRQQHGFSVEVSDGLMLYYDRFSYYSQKVVMALYEKNLSFDSKIVNLIKSEQYQPWFLFLNPRGEVPVLQDTGKIIPDSGRILDYLEDNFSNGDTPRLIPMDQGPEIRQNVTHFRHLIQKAPGGALTTGALLNPHLIKNPKTPFLAPIRRALANAEKTGGQKLREIAEKNPEHKEVLLKKAEAREQSYKELSQEKKFLEVLDQVHVILDEVEAELAKHKDDKEDWWLCSDRFTIADIELTILLVRISQLGLEHIFWASGKRPFIERYYERVKLRDSYKKTVPGTLVLLKTIILAQAPILIGVVAAIALVVGGAVIAKKYV